MSDWPDGWYEVDEEAAAGLTQELAKEVAEGHPLWSLACRVVARCDHGDDVLAVLDDGTVAEVHLTWSSGKDRPPWPYTARYPSLADWRAARETEPDC